MIEIRSQLQDVDALLRGAGRKANSRAFDRIAGDSTRFEGRRVATGMTRKVIRDGFFKTLMARRRQRNICTDILTLNAEE